MAEYDRSIGDVLKTALNDAQDLVRGEIALAKAEMREEVRKVGAGVVSLLVAAVAGLIALVFILTAAAWAMFEIFGWPIWAGFLLVAVVVGLVAGILALVGRSRLTSQPHMPRTMETMKENMEWMRARTS